MKIRLSVLIAIAVALVAGTLLVFIPNQAQIRD